MRSSQPEKTHLSLSALPRARYTRAMHEWIPVRRFVLLVCAGVGVMSTVAPAAGQFRDGQLPERGQFWLEFTPALENWSEQFALDSPDPALSDGDREPLTADFNGPLTRRHFPDGVFLAGLNEDADALGFDLVAPEEFSLGGLDVSTMNAQVRRLELGLEYGLLQRLALAIRVPIVYTEMDIAFAYDSLSAIVVPGRTVLSEFESFFVDFGAAFSGLEQLIAGGTLTPEEAATAMALLDSSGFFGEARERRIRDNLLLPIAGSSPGTQIAGFYSQLSEQYALFGLTLPELTLPAQATSADVASYFTTAPVRGTVPTPTTRGWSMPEIEAGVRFSLLDTWRSAAARDLDANEVAETDGAEEEVTAPVTPAPLLRLRTTIGATARFPVLPANDGTMFNPADFIGLPLGDGQRDVELAVYQDVGIGGWFVLSAAGRYGLQLADELVLRVHTPDRPFALFETESVVERDLGDYLALRLAPQLHLNEFLSFGLEYGYWRKGSDRYTLVSTAGELADVTPLEVETSQTRQRLGVGVFYRAGGRAAEAGRAPPWLFGFVYQGAIGGSGGQTPAAQLVTFTLRAPVQIF